MPLYLLCAALLAFAQTDLSGLRISAPTGLDSYETSQPTIELAGVLSLPQPIHKLEWETSRGARGSIQPASYWRTGPIPLTPGENWVAVTATDENGQATQRAILVFRSGPSKPAVTFSDIVEEPGWTKDRRRGASVITYSSLLWPNATVPYVIDAGLPAATRQSLQQALAHWEANTPIRFVPRTSQASYVRVLQPPGLAANCSASLGRRSGESTISLPEWCGPTEIIHELGHTLGLMHEHTRLDRDRYVEVLYPNIQKTISYDFDVPLVGFADDGLYDFSSIMHYTIWSGSRNGQPVLRTLPPGLSVSGEGLSPGDIDAVRRLYGSPPSLITITTNPADLRIIVDGETLTSPRSFSWEPGTSHTLSLPSPQGSGDIRHVFGRWSNDGPQTQTILASSSTTTYVANMIPQCKVVFEPPSDPLTGTFTISPLSPDNYYACDSEITLNATPAPGQAFSRWNWTDLVSRNPVTFQVAVARRAIYPAFTDRPMVRVETSVPGVSVVVDGTRRSTPYNFVWTPGSSHTLAAADQQPGSIRYSFAGWSQGGAASQTVLAPESNATFTANFKTQYRLWADVAAGDPGYVSVTPGSPDYFYEAGTTVQLTAQPASVFSFWTGDLTGTDNPQSLVMDDERLAVAHIIPAGSPTISAVSPAAVVAGSPPLPLNVTGIGFYNGLTQVRFNGLLRPFRAGSSLEMQVSLNAADLSVPGTATLSVSNPGYAELVAGTATFTITAPPSDCRFTLSPASLSTGSYGGSDTVTVTTDSGCAWSAAAESPWIEVIPHPRSPGSGTLNLWVAPNGSSQQRTDTVRAAGQVLTVSQAGAACNATLTPTSRTAPAAGRDGVVALTLLVPDCRWTAESSASWLKLTSPTSGAGSAVITYTAEPNRDPNPRNAQIRVAGQTIAVQQPGTASTLSAVSAASFLRDAPLAPGSLAAAFGRALARQTEVAASLPLPSALAGAKLLLQRSDQTFVTAQLHFVSPGQINFIVPSLPEGPTTVVVTVDEQAVASGAVEIARVAPGLFSANANGQGAAAGVVLTVSADGRQTSQPTFQCGATPSSCVAAPIDLGADTDQVILLLFGTGIRGVGSLSEVSASIGGVEAEVLYAGRQGDFAGLDQVNVRLPRSLAGRGEVAVLLSVEGKTANTLTVSIR